MLCKLVLFYNVLSRISQLFRFLKLVIFKLSLQTDFQAQEGGQVEGRNGGRKSRLRQDDAGDQCFYRQWHDAKFSCLEPAPTKSKPRQNHEVLSCTSEPPSTVSTLIECDPDSRQTVSSDHAVPFASEDGGQKLDQLKMRLPVDEDDYLQPKLSKPNVYLELVSNNSNAGNNNIPVVYVLRGATRPCCLLKEE